MDVSSRLAKAAQFSDLQSSTETNHTMTLGRTGLEILSLNSLECKISWKASCIRKHTRICVHGPNVAQRRQHGMTGVETGSQECVVHCCWPIRYQWFCQLVIASFVQCLQGKLKQAQKGGVVHLVWRRRKCYKRAPFAKNSHVCWTGCADTHSWWEFNCIHKHQIIRECDVCLAPSSKIL